MSLPQLSTQPTMVKSTCSLMDPPDKRQRLSLTLSFVPAAPIFKSMVLYMSLPAEETQIVCIIKRRGQCVCVFFLCIFVLSLPGSDSYLGGPEAAGIYQTYIPPCRSPPAWLLTAGLWNPCKPPSQGLHFVLRQFNIDSIPLNTLQTNFQPPPRRGRQREPPLSSEHAAIL